MWKPPEKIAYSPRGGHWPSEREVRRSRLFQPLEHGRLSLAQRTWIPAMVPWRATEEGEVTRDVIDWYRRFAQGRPGAIVVEATGIRDIPSGPLLRASHDRYIEGLQDIVRAVREASGGETKLFIQLIDFLAIKRRQPAEKFIRRFLAIGDHHREALGMTEASEDEVRETLAAMSEEELEAVLTTREFESLSMGSRERVTDIHLPHVADLPETLPGLFADAARRAEAAGFDGVELHYAHAYTMASFLSALNTRDDGYGGDPDGRVRLPLEVFDAVRGAVGDSFTVGCRMLAEECIESGSGLGDALFFAEKFALAGMDFISLSRGGKFEDAKRPKVGEAAYPYTGRSGYECMPQYLSDARGPFGRNLAPARAIRERLRAGGLDTPIVVAGGIHNFDQAESALSAGEGDIVGLARQAMADPDWFEKVRSGNGSKVRLCEYTNYCEGLDQKHKMVTCKLWDREALDEETPRTPDGKRRTVAPQWGRDRD
ncbi:2,4-dienoyl-CoA reductase [Erythrobacter litoralis]|uniref:NADH oxidase n=1 Tax=Erythrobacter litoralis TaxID=39960 RepID=A0A074N3E3_9SPHN|nr:NADH oxidase [Erythrobacter litoralis]AOL23849.1 2,4-dienoyl-CoA reductase [Erythrobacter litoralis]KEO98668.1 NADH oxidase [Erythrobacter litoralis]